jgi:energy-coupling factor transporter transmembrane protein EcfT
MHISLTELERESFRKSLVHRIDGRAKILMTLVIVVFAVSLPRMEALNFQKLVLLETYLVALLLLARLDFSYIAIRFAIAMLCRGYNADGYVYVGSKNLRILDVSFLALQQVS